MPSTRVLVVDDYEPWQRFVCSTLQNQPEIQVIGQVCDGLEGVRQAEALHPDLILLDIGLPELNGIEVAHRLSHKLPATQILFVSENRDTAVVEAALSNGAKGFVWKADAGHALLPAIAAALKGEVFVSSGMRNGQELEVGAVQLMHRNVQRSG